MEILDFAAVIAEAENGLSFWAGKRCRLTMGPRGRIMEGRSDKEVYTL